MVLYSNKNIILLVAIFIFSQLLFEETIIQKLLFSYYYGETVFDLE